jgi:hypothetical protein
MVKTMLHGKRETPSARDWVPLVTRPDERWADVERAPGYLVSDQGRVLSPHGNLIGNPSHTRGYYRVNLPGQRITMVHHLVAEAFIGPSRGAQVNFIDKNPANCRADNLRYGTLPMGGDWSLQVPE